MNEKEIYKAKETYLNSYGELLTEAVMACEEYIQFMNRNLYPGNNLSLVPHGANGSDLSNNAIKEDEYRVKKEDAEKALLSRKRHIEEKIQFFPAKYKKVISVKFIQLKSVEREMGYSHSQAYRLIRESIDNIEMPEEELKYWNNRRKKAAVWGKK